MTTAAPQAVILWRETISKIQNERPKQSIPRRAGFWVPNFPDSTIRRAERESKPEDKTEKTETF
jgi:hypothetical protein